jgi:hypothetical protein
MDGGEKTMRRFLFKSSYSKKVLQGWQFSLRIFWGMLELTEGGCFIAASQKGKKHLLSPLFQGLKKCFRES